MLSPEQARDLVEHFGAKKAAAQVVGVDESTVRHWLDPERRRAAMRAHYERLSGPDYNRLLLRHRRTQALTRRRKRLATEEA